MSEENTEIIEEETVSEEIETSVFKTTAKVEDSAPKQSSDEGWYSGPCKRCDVKVSAPIKDGKVSCDACGASF